MQRTEILCGKGAGALHLKLYLNRLLQILWCSAPIYGTSVNKNVKSTFKYIIIVKSPITLNIILNQIKNRLL